jgi:hypothetical protein
MANEDYRIYSSLDPVIHSGETGEIAVTQSLTGDKLPTLLHASGPTVKVSVQGPQTSITEEDIVGVYPAPGSNDSPDNFLPHIALSRRTLPWERRGPQDGAPWLALLVVTQDDLTITTRPGPVIGLANANAAAAVVTVKPPQPPPPAAATLRPAIIASEVTPAAKAAVASAGSAAMSSGANIAVRPIVEVGDMTPKSIQVSDLAATDSATRTQLLSIPGITNSTQINVIAIPAATLKTILPAPGDLKLLCNVKEVIGDDGSTFTAIVMSGRLPDAGDTNTDPPRKHTALLVSLEHRDDLYTRASGWINLIVLHSWTFIPSKGGDFEEVCQGIGYHPNGGVLRFGNLPSAPADPTKSLSGNFDSLLDKSGYLLTPLDHAEAGNVTWRSPLRPFPPPPRNINGFAVRSDPEEFANAPAGAPLDYSHASAFELGKLLALADIGVREDLRDIHEMFNIPSNFVAMSAIPEALQKPYWGIDQGQSLDQSQAAIDQGMQNPWSFGNNQNMVGVQNAAGNGQVAGISKEMVAAFQTSVTQAVGAVAQGPAAPSQVSQIDIASVTEVNLAIEFPELVNAARAGGA